MNERAFSQVNILVSRNRIFAGPTITMAFCSCPQLLKILPEKSRKNRLCDSVQKKWGSFTSQSKIRCF